MMRRRRSARASRLVLLTALAVCLGLATPGCRSTPPPSLTELGEAAFARGAYREADGYYTQATAQNSLDARAIHGRARVALALRDPETSLRHYARLAQLDRAWLAGSARDDYAQTLLEAGAKRLERGKPGAALEALRALQKLRPEQKGFARLMGRALTSQGEWLAMHGRRSEALAHFEEAIGITPQLAASYIGAAEVLLASGKKKEALALLTDAHDHHPSDSRVLALTVEAMGLY